MPRLILQNVNLLDGDSPARPNSTVVVEGARIVHAGPGPAPKANPTDRVVDLGGRTVMPGMVNCHYHAAYHNIGASHPVMPVGMESPVGLLALRGAHNLELALQCGFTACISAGSANGADAVFMMAMAQGLIKGPRLVPCGRDVSTTGHSQDLAMQPWWLSSYSGHFNRADGADSMRRAVREEIRNGAQIVKLFATGGHGVGVPPRLEMTPEELKAAVDTAHERGARIRAHLAGADAIALSLELGMDLIDHGDDIDERCIDLLLKRDVPLAPSMLFMDVIMQLQKTAAPAVYERMRIDAERYKEQFRVANKAGVRLVVGDDYGVAVMPHGRYIDELIYYVEEVGISPLDVIRWATKNGAEVFGLGKELGVLKAGNIADLLVVNGDPSANIHVLKDRANLLAIMKDGELFKDELGALETAGRAGARARVA